MGKKDADEVTSASVIVSVRITSGQRERLKRRADGLGLDVGPYVRRLITLDLEAAEETGPDRTDDGTPETAPPVAVASPPPAPPPVPPRELAAVQTSIDALRTELGRMDGVVRELRSAGVQHSLDLLRNELGRTDGVVRELRSDVATAIRVLLLVSNPPGAEGTQLTEKQIDDLVESVFPPS